MRTFRPSSIIRRSLAALFACSLLLAALPASAESGDIVIDSQPKVVSGGAVRTDQAVLCTAPKTNGDILALIKKSDVIIECVVTFAPSVPAGMKEQGTRIQEHSLQVCTLYKGDISGQEFWLDIDRTAFLPGQTVNLQVGDRALLFLKQTGEREYDPLYFAYRSNSLPGGKNSRAFARLLERVGQSCNKRPFLSDDLGIMVCGMEYVKERFAFPSAPKAVKREYLLNKKGETVTVWSFDTLKDMKTCEAMINGCSLTYRNNTVYSHSDFPATYYSSAQRKEIVLYCGADKAVDQMLKKTWKVAGGYGGYFRMRELILVPGEDPIVVMPLDKTTPDTVDAITKQSEGIYIVKVIKTPVWGKGSDFRGAYELKVTKTVRGMERKSLQLPAYPGVMRTGGSYVVFVKPVDEDAGDDKLMLTDETNNSVFEMDDRGYVLPIREYGMYVPVELSWFLSGLPKGDDITIDVIEQVSGGSIHTDQPVLHTAPETSGDMDALIQKADVIIECVVTYAPSIPAGMAERGTRIQEHSLQVCMLYKGDISGQEFWLDIDRTTLLSGQTVNLKVGDRALLFLKKTQHDGVYDPLYFAYRSNCLPGGKNSRAFARLIERVGQNCDKRAFLSDNLYIMVQGMEYAKERFAFSTAPRAVKREYLLNKKGETVTVWSFDTLKDMKTCEAMINGCSLTYRTNTVYPQSDFPATYYSSAQRMEIVLYCGTDKTVDQMLQERYTVAGSV